VFNGQQRSTRTLSFGSVGGWMLAARINVDDIDESSRDGRTSGTV
jgi:hypothetical protein